MGLLFAFKIGLWRSLASALAWGARGPGFKSPQPDQIPQHLLLFYNRVTILPRTCVAFESSRVNILFGL